MEKKTVAITIFACLVLVFIVAIGATLSAFKVSKGKVEVESIIILASDGVKITNDKGEDVSNLEVKSASVGVRPATGEQDPETSIPTTVNNAVGTEGAYACFKVTSNIPYEIVLKSCTFENGYEENLRNVRLGIMGQKNEPIGGNDIGSVLVMGDSANDKETVVVVWLDSDTKKSIAGSKIKLELEARAQ